MAPRTVLLNDTARTVAAIDHALDFDPARPALRGITGPGKPHPLLLLAVDAMLGSAAPRAALQDMRGERDRLADRYADVLTAAQAAVKRGAHQPPQPAHPDRRGADRPRRAARRRRAPGGPAAVNGRRLAEGGDRVKVRIEGLPGEVEALAGLLRGAVEVVEESRDYPNHGASRLVRRYLDVRGGEVPVDDAPRRPSRITRARRLD